MADNAEVAAWLMAEVRGAAPQRAYQNRLVRKMREVFGDDFIYTNHNGNPAISKGVLAEFGKLKDEFVLWDRANQSWRAVTPEQLEQIESREAERAIRKAENARRRAEWEASRLQ
jgi:hypothetical protein